MRKHSQLAINYLKIDVNIDNITLGAKYTALTTDVYRSFQNVIVKSQLRLQPKEYLQIDILCRCAKLHTVNNNWCSDFCCTKKMQFSSYDSTSLF